MGWVKPCFRLNLANKEPPWLCCKKGQMVYKVCKTRTEGPGWPHLKSDCPVNCWFFSWRILFIWSSKSGFARLTWLVSSDSRGQQFPAVTLALPKSGGGGRAGASAALAFHVSTAAWAVWKIWGGLWAIVGTLLFPWASQTVAIPLVHWWTSFILFNVLWNIGCLMWTEVVQGF